MHVLSRFLEAELPLELREAGLHSPKSRGRNDPPDCEARDVQGGRWGFELTEFVDEAFVRTLGSEQRFSPKQYSAGDFVTELQHCLDKKRRPSNCIRGAPYRRLVLVILTNEMRLSFDLCQRTLKSHKFTKPTPWDCAFFVLPPAVSSRPLRCPEEDLKYRVIQIAFTS
jgi:hypothetical protein